VLPPNNFDLTDYVTRYCILFPQTDTLLEEEAEEEASAAMENEEAQ
jgi:hypothetical protein